MGKIKSNDLQGINVKIIINDGCEISNNQVSGNI